MFGRQGKALIQTMRSDCSRWSSWVSETWDSMATENSFSLSTPRVKQSSRGLSTFTVNSWGARSLSSSMMSMASSRRASGWSRAR